MTRPALIALLICLAAVAKSAEAQRLVPTFFPEQRSINVRDPSQLARSRIPDSLPPSTVSSPQPELHPIHVSLDEAIRMSIGNVDVVRVLAGTTATNSGRTIYDPAVTNTSIDQENARFDPTLSVNNTWNRLENPVAIFDPLPPGNPLITGNRQDSFVTSTNLTKENAFGGTFGVGFDASPTQITPGPFTPPSPLNPQTPSSTNINYKQPLLQGGRLGPNLAPLVLARIDTERSYFQLKDAMQEHVRGVIEAYWSLVAARTDVWARRTQVEQLTEILKRIDATMRTGTGTTADKAQAQLALANFRANLIASEANLIQREAALRNIAGLAPSDGTRLVPTTPPQTERFLPDWLSIVELACERRPDVIELKLILEADQQQWQIARNNALPRLDAVSQYRWNGLDGTMPNGSSLSSASGAFTDWTLGVNFSVPLGLRQSRAALRARELIIARDRINLQQGLHSSIHQLATSVRTLDQTYEQYLAFREAREAARVNLKVQVAKLATGTVLFINVQQAVTDWGNLISAEANALTQYNTQLATLERQTGTILETHAVLFYEERFGSIGPLGRFCDDVCYPLNMRPTTNADRYPTGEQPSEETFDLQQPGNLREKLRGLNYDDIKLPSLKEIMEEQGLPPAPPPKPEPPPSPDPARAIPPPPDSPEAILSPRDAGTVRLNPPGETLHSKSWFNRLGRLPQSASR
ncbi:MAG: TolC family protein [Planctomycetota bacterium]